MEDLVECYLKAVERSDQVAGMSFNIGGGLENALSIAEFFDLLGSVSGRAVAFQKSEWRPGDQPVYVSDNSKAACLLDWRPRVGVREGLERLRKWVVENRGLLEKAASRL